MNMIALLPIGSAILITAALIRSIRLQERAAKAKEAAWQIERAKLPMWTSTGSLSPTRGDAKWIDGAWVKNEEIARREAAAQAIKTQEQACMDTFVNSVSTHIFQPTFRLASVLFGVFLLIVSLGLLIWAFTFFGLFGVIPAGFSFVLGITGFCAIKVGLGSFPK